MSGIQTFKFERKQFGAIKEYQFGQNRPVVYIIEGGKEAYVGETTNLIVRTKNHLDNIERQQLKNLYVITDEEYNKSAILDIESLLIQYLLADQRYVLQNKTNGLKDHNYYDREKYTSKFEMIWEELRKISLAKNSLIDLKNTDVFKYSPYKALTTDQILTVEEIYGKIVKNDTGTFLIHGMPGTGKTVLATFLFKYLKEQDATKNLEVGLVIPMTSLRGTIKKVFSKIKGLKANMVIGPNDVVKKKYDILIVDEAHRLGQRVNLTNFPSYDNVNKFLNLHKEATQLDWIMNSSRYQVFFYDENQSVRPSDVKPETFKRLKTYEYTLSSQLRVQGGDAYIKLINQIFDEEEVTPVKISNYDLKLFSDIRQFRDAILAQNEKHELSRMVAGYAWERKSKKNADLHDIEIDGLKLTWNSTNADWINSYNSKYEVGCIHTVQGYDLNYVGVIIGPELTYDPVNKKLNIVKSNYRDMNGKRGVENEEELKRYIINIYKTLLTRGIKGTYIYIVDLELRKMLEGVFFNGLTYTFNNA